MSRVESVRYRGKRYYRYPDSKQDTDSKYFRRHSGFLHVAVWEDHHGPVPKGREVHHKDGNPGNNAISNLECLTHAEHSKAHEKELSAEFKEQRRQRLISINPLSRAWHSSPEGTEHHRRNAQAMLAAVKPEWKHCEWCYKPFLDKSSGGIGLYCSQTCSQQYRNATGVDNITSICSWCGKEFVHNKYQHKECCSKSCAMYKRWQNKRAKGL